MNNTTLLNEPSWYAVLTRSRQEKTSACMLESLGIHNFLPLIMEKRQWSDRKQAVAAPLFPGYFFVRIPMLREFQLPVLKVPGIVKFIGNQRGPQAIPDEEINSVRAILSSRIECTPCPISRVGDRVRISRGVLAGIEGTFVRSGAGGRLLISVEAIEQSIAVHVEASDVEPFFFPPPPALPVAASGAFC
jgi:transcription antitermination factor NusG